MASNVQDPQELLRNLRGNAPRRTPTVHALAAYSGHTDCRLASLGFAAGVDFDRLLVGTEFAAPYGQSPFAFSRGRAFENMLRERHYSATLALLRDTMGFGVADARVINLRDGYSRNRDGMRLRSHETRSLIDQIVQGDRSAPNVIDGAVLGAQVGGVQAHFEADALATRFAGPIHAGEVKSFPVVDGQAEKGKLAGALDQVAVYILLTRRLVDELGGDPERVVSTEALLITPRNTGLTPTLSTVDVRRRVSRAEKLLATAPSAADVAYSVPSDLSFGAVSDQRAPAIIGAGIPDPEAAPRIETLHALADHAGTVYIPECLVTCGLARFCRARAFRASAVSMSGLSLVRLLPGVHSLSRAADLADGAQPTPREAPAAVQLERAARLYRRQFGPESRSVPAGASS